MNNENTQETIDLVSLFNILKRYIWVIMIVSILTGALAFSYSNYFVNEKYSSYTTLFVKPSTSEEGNINYNDILVTGKLVNVYAEIAKSRSVINKVIEDLELDGKYGMTYDDVKNSLSVTSVNNTEIISIKIILEDPNLAMIIANKIAEVFIVEIQEIMYFDNETNNINVIDEAIKTEVPVSPNVKLNTAIGLVLGVMLSVGYVLLKEFLDQTIKTPKDIENYLGIPVLGVVPDKTQYFKELKIHT